MKKKGKNLVGLASAIAIAALVYMSVLDTDHSYLFKAVGCLAGAVVMFSFVLTARVVYSKWATKIKDFVVDEWEWILFMLAFMAAWTFLGAVAGDHWSHPWWGGTAGAAFWWVGWGSIQLAD